MKKLVPAKGKLSLDGYDLHMFQDFPKKIWRLRDSYRELRRIKNLRFGILYHARLSVTINEETLIFRDCKEAEEVLKKKQFDLFGD